MKSSKSEDLTGEGEKQRKIDVPGNIRHTQIGRQKKERDAHLNQSYLKQRKTMVQSTDLFKIMNIINRITLQIFSGKACQPRILYPAKPSSKNKEKMT